MFVGRDDLFYQLEASARLQRLVILTGSGGTGKTELAKGFARWWRDTGGTDDPRLILWHSFEPGAATFGLDSVITSIGLKIYGTGFARLEQADRLAAVKTLLGQHRSLLIWDNFESVAEMPDPGQATPALDEPARHQLRDFAHWLRDRSPSALILTTRARETWLGEAARIPVGGLNRAEAAQYATQLLVPFPAAKRRRDRRSFGDLLDWLDGHPLAMRLTLPRLQDTDPAPLLSALKGTAPLPAADPAETGRLSSLAASITYSFTHLSAPTARLLPAVSLFTSIADEDVLTKFSAVDGVPERFAATSKEQWTAALEDAARVGLLTPVGAGMYRIHPALPGYLTAAWQAGTPVGYDQERQAAEQALRTAYAAFSRWLTAQVQTGDAALAYTLTELQRGTLGAMLAHALDHRAWADADILVRPLDTYWQARGLSGEAAAWTDRILNTTVDIGQGPVAGADSLWLFTLFQRATRQKDAGQPDRAAEAYQQILTWQRDQPQTEANRSNTAATYHQLGRTAQDRGRLAEAEEWYRRSLAISEELGDRPGLAGSYHQLGMAAQGRGRLAEAEEWYRRSLAIKEELGDRPGMASSYHQLGMAAQGRGRLAEAEEWYRRSLAIKEELGDRPGMASSYHQLGMAAQGRGRLAEAEEWYRRSLAIEEELGDRPGMASSYHQLGTAAQGRGRLAEAEEWYRRSLAIKEELGDRPGMASSYHQLGTAAQGRGRLAEAEEWYRRSLAISEELDNRPYMASSYHQLGMAAQDRGRLDEAEEWYRRSLAISEELDNRPGAALTYAQVGLLAEARAQPQQALAWNIRSVTLFPEFPSPLTGTAPDALTRLTRQLGLPALEQAWQQTTAHPLPEHVRDYVTSQDDESSRP